MDVCLTEREMISTKSLSNQGSEESEHSSHNEEVISNKCSTTLTTNVVSNNVIVPKKRGRPRKKVKICVSQVSIQQNISSSQVTHTIQRNDEPSGSIVIKKRGRPPGTTKQKFGRILRQRESITRNVKLSENNKNKTKAGRPLGWRKKIRFNGYITGMQTSNVQTNNVQTSNVQTSNVSTNHMQTSNMQTSNVQTSNVQNRNLPRVCDVVAIPRKRGRPAGTGKRQKAKLRAMEQLRRQLSCNGLVIRRRGRPSKHANVERL